MKGWRSILVAGLALAALTVSVSAAAPPVVDRTKKGELDVEPPPARLPPVFDKKAPEGVSDLKAIQDHVKKVLQRVTPAVVAIQIGGSAGSGVIIDAEGHVLTAGHVSGKPGRECWLILADGQRLKGKTLGQNGRIDSGLIKITDKPKGGKPLPYVTMGDSEKVKISEWVISIGHPGGYKPTRKTVVRLGRVMVNTKGFIRSDCTLVGGDSGGPLFNMHGKVIGIHSRIGPSIDENVHVPVNTYRDTWDRLVKAESFGGWEDFFRSTPTSSAYLGVVLDRNSLKIDEVTKGMPAEKAGLKPGDVIVGIDGTQVKSRRDLFEFMQKKKPDDEVTVVVKRDDKEMKVKVKLVKRPAE